MAKRLSVKLTPKWYEIEVEGNWSTLITILLGFILKYTLGYSLAQDPGLKEDTTFEKMAVCVSGASAGLFIGRIVTLIQKSLKQTRPSIQP